MQGMGRPCGALLAVLPPEAAVPEVEGTSPGSIVLRDSARRRRSPGSGALGGGAPEPGGAGPSWSSGRPLAYSLLPLPEESMRSCRSDRP